MIRQADVAGVSYSFRLTHEQDTALDDIHAVSVLLSRELLVSDVHGNLFRLTHDGWTEA